MGCINKINMKKLILILATLANLTAHAQCRVDYQFTHYGGGKISSYQEAQSKGLLTQVNGNNAYIFSFKYPKSGFLEMEIAIFSCDDCAEDVYFKHPVTSTCQQSQAFNCLDVKLLKGCSVINTGHMQAGLDCMEGDSIYNVLITLQGNCQKIELMCIILKEDPLPIKLKSFNGISNNFINTLQWVTGSEINNDYFTIEKSYNGIDFMSIGTVRGNGNTNYDTKYMFVDHSPEEVNYYRLKQTDYDGKFTYSNIIFVRAGYTEPLRINTYDLTGRKINGVATGLYIVERVYSNGITTIEKTIKP